MKSKRVEHANNMLELALSIDRAEAVAKSFAERYIDIDSGTSHAFVVAIDERHFENLYNALIYMWSDIQKQAEAALKEAEGLAEEETA